jgi:hypothetical protein
MTTDQRQALSKIRANHAYAEGDGRSSSPYNSEEIGLVLQLVEEQAQTLQCIRDDLETIVKYIDTNRGDLTVSSMIESTLEFLKEET